MEGRPTLSARPHRERPVDFFEAPQKPPVHETTRDTRARIDQPIQHASVTQDRDQKTVDFNPRHTDANSRAEHSSAQRTASSTAEELPIPKLNPPNGETLPNYGVLPDATPIHTLKEQISERISQRHSFSTFREMLNNELLINRLWSQWITNKLASLESLEHISHSEQDSLKKKLEQLQLERGLIPRLVQKLWEKKHPEDQAAFTLPLRDFPDMPPEGVAKLNTELEALGEIQPIPGNTAHNDALVKNIEEQRKIAVEKAAEMRENTGTLTKIYANGLVDQRLTLFELRQRLGISSQSYRETQSAKGAIYELAIIRAGNMLQEKIDREEMTLEQVENLYASEILQSMRLFAPDAKGKRFRMNLDMHSDHAERINDTIPDTQTPKKRGQQVA